jgi:hypothetical protein
MYNQLAVCVVSYTYTGVIARCRDASTAELRLQAGPEVPDTSQAWRLWIPDLFSNLNRWQLSAVWCHLCMHRVVQNTKCQFMYREQAAGQTWGTRHITAAAEWLLTCFLALYNRWQLSAVCCVTCMHRVIAECTKHQQCHVQKQAAGFDPQVYQTHHSMCEWLLTCFLALYNQYSCLLSVVITCTHRVIAECTKCQYMWNRLQGQTEVPDTCNVCEWLLTCFLAV